MSQKVQKLKAKVASVDDYRQQVAERVQSENAEKKAKKTAIEEKLRFAFECIKASEFGDAMLYTHLHRGKHVYVRSTKEWLAWKGHFWELDKGGDLAKSGILDVIAYYREVRNYCLSKVNEAIKAEKEAEANNFFAKAESLRKRIYALYSESRPLKVLKCVRYTEDPLSIDGEEIDAKPLLLACLNGVLDLKTGELKAGKPEDYLVGHCNTEFLGIDTPALIFEQTLQEIFGKDEEVIAYVKRFFGYCLTGLVSEEKIHIFHGRGANGKSLLMRIMELLLGNLAGPMESEKLLTQRFSKTAGAADSSTIALKGKRMVFASEIDEDRKVSLGSLKLLTGADSFTARSPFDKYDQTFRGQYKIIWALNDLPTAPADDDALWRRMEVLPFEQRFSEKPDLSKGEMLMDKKRIEALEKELPGILATCVRALIAPDGFFALGGLNPPEKMRLATESYKETEDELGDFLDQVIVPEQELLAGVTEDCFVQAGELHRIFMLWQQSRGMKRPWTIQKFGKRMTKKGVKREKVGGIPRYIGTPKGDCLENEVQIVTCDHKKRIDIIAIMSEKKVPVKASIGLHMPDGGFDGGSSFEFTANGGRQTALLTGDEDGSRSLVIMITIALVDIDAFGIDAADIDGLADGLIERVAVIGVVLEGNTSQHQALPVGRCNANLCAELIRRAGFAL